ncbi:MAG: acetate kinase [Ktedonobacteraceae bacterium]
MKILVFNAGSSSQKSALYEINEAPSDKAPDAIWSSSADWSKKQGSTEIKVKANGQSNTHEIASNSRPEVIKQMLTTLWSGPTKVVESLSEVAVVGHRIVHGGAEYTQSVRVTPEVKENIRRFAEFAPLHNPANLEGIEAIEQVKNDLPQVASFDTSFHSQIPQEVSVYPGPYSWFEQGIRRYGFHGISHQYCTRQLGRILGKDASSPGSLKFINCHLGNGSSLAAIKNGRSIDTTMGFTPLEGLMMGTRSGTVDPSILIYFAREKGYDADKLEQTLNKESGLKGISGVSGDMRQIMQASKEGNERAKLALDMFIYRLRYFIGAMAASLNCVDVLAFTGGIGENASDVRARVCAGLGYLNLSIDEQKNSASPVDQEISTPGSPVRVLVIHTEEDWEIARDCWHIMQAR